MEGALSRLTEKERAFVSALVRNGGNKKAAAQAAGYATPDVTGHVVAKRPHILAELRQARERHINTRLVSLALNTMEELMTDKSVSAAVRFQSARWALEAAGHNSKETQALGFDPDKPLTEMSLSELQAFIAAGATALESMKAPQRVNGASSATIDHGNPPANVHAQSETIDKLIGGGSASPIYVAHL